MNNGPEHNNAHADEHPRYVMGRPYEPQSGPGQYRPPPYTPHSQAPLPQTPISGPGQPYENMPGYGHPPPTPRDQYNSLPPQYAPSSAPSTKRKPQRAAQACDSCRNLKAKCDELKPCTNCRDKGLQCNFREPPPKQQDKSQEVLMEAIANLTSQITSQITTLTQQHQKLSDRFDRDMDEMKEWMKANGYKGPKAPNGATQFKEETVEDKHLSQAALPSELDTEPGTGDPDTEPPPEGLPPTDYSEEEDQGDPKPPGPPAIPVNHTTGAAKLLNSGPIAMMTRNAPFPKHIHRRDLFPIIQEERRGLLRLFGKGEGFDLARGYNIDVQVEHTETPSDLHSEASSPAAVEDWGQVGGVTPPGNAENPIQRGELNANGMPDFKRETVIDLVDSYMNHMNIMHPLITEKNKDQLIDYFLKSIADSQPKHRQVAALHQQGSTPESPGSKRKRSRDGSSEYQDPSSHIYRDSSKPGHPPRTISTALVLAMLALGAICKNKDRIRDVSGTPDQDTPSYRSSPQLKNGYPPSPINGSPIMPGQSPEMASPQDVDRLHPHSRRTSMDRSAPHLTSSGVKPRNMDLMPGLHYFAIATDILGNQLAGNTLQHVHVGILLSLYHGQLGRVLESWPYLNAACRSLVFKLRNRLGRWEKLMARDGMQTGQTPARDNGYLFAFWTCLQLESDILAELPVEQSGILKLEAKVPWPNMVLAKADGFSEDVLDNYSAQLFLRKRLNEIHTMFYSPDLDNGPSPRAPLAHTSVAYMAQFLENWRKTGPEKFRWNDGDPPSDNILIARLRAKYYGARVITCRYFVLKILENSYTTSTAAGGKNQKITDEFREGVSVPIINKDATSVEHISTEVLGYVRSCIDALKESTMAFDNVVEDIGKQRLIVTNIWGTAHAQWGNMLTLLAVYQDPILKDMVEREELTTLLKRTIRFLRMAAQPNSALELDIKILVHLGEKFALLRSGGGVGSFTSSHSSGDVVMTGH
ncbi:hypothetical protein BP5796_01823 [Coleophoma crateriformis]|uniref:Zn(2)-C6 fungal-type domain-containing protein n=1 Tax=Coleophoma crateriformis TaxID=565419 RepID=A0A3D8T1Q7_9HELO|nr:hypothetical protein BP5796_01823 [Coleophoma crateriformis]